MDDQANDGRKQVSLFDEYKGTSDVNESPATQYELDAAKHALDELFKLTLQYRSPAKFFELMAFVRGFRFYSPYNALLIYLQMPGAAYVAPARRWRDVYQRTVRPGERPLVILQPGGPFMFVFDVSQTEGKPFPERITDPFKVATDVFIDLELNRLVTNAVRDGVRLTEGSMGPGSAGKIEETEARGRQSFYAGKDKQKKPVYVNVPIRYDLVVNGSQKGGTKYSTIAHELGHLYCGHLGSPNRKWWPNRLGLKKEEVEFEAEAVSYLVCGRFGFIPPSAEYLAHYLTTDQIPAISLECVVKVTGLIEDMSTMRLKPRKKGKGEA